ncbi:GTPase-activating protein [Ascosphaera aggregata]|nr:GTPase-activating protein [Ascosphaera aggregata]
MRSVGIVDMPFVIHGGYIALKAHWRKLKISGSGTQKHTAHLSVSEEAVPKMNGGDDPNRRSSSDRPESDETGKTEKVIGYNDTALGSSNDTNDDSLMRSITHTMQKELAHLASSLPRASSQIDRDDIETTLHRVDSITGLNYDDPILDPESPKFDFHKWSRMYMKLLEDEGIKKRRAGFTFKNLTVTGSGADLHLQPTFVTPFRVLWAPRETLGLGTPERHILSDFNGTVKQGELLVVLGRPGSGCSTFLKSIAGQTDGLLLQPGSEIHYNGIPQEIMKKEFRGETVYSGEDEHHFPHLTVGETLEFAAAARTPQRRILGMERSEFAQKMTKVVMSIFGLSHTFNTRVGNEFIRGVSGGERKRVSICELALAGAPICCWDNSTRGLDSATALEFTQTLRVAAKIMGTTHAVAIYQASQDIYDLFDKAIVLYEGRQIFFGPANVARKYFEDMGYLCPPRQTTGDFLTSVTNPRERVVKPGYEAKVPRTALEFERYWIESDAYKAMKNEMAEQEQLYPPGHSPALQQFRESHQEAQAKHVRGSSPYTLSITMQTKLCAKRAYRRIYNDMTSTITIIIAEICLSLIIGSLFFRTTDDTDGFFGKSSVLYFAILLNAFLSVSELNSLYAQRPIIAKHEALAFYYPWVEAAAGIVADIPINLRYEASTFFVFFLFSFITMLTMSAIFRTLGAATKKIEEALALAAPMVLAIVVYTGFVIQKHYMRKWFKWLMYLNPLSYAYESMLVNEVHGQWYPCGKGKIVPPYATGTHFQCPVRGARPGELLVSGDDWVESSFGYSYDHIWRNLGICLAFMVGMWIIYLTTSQLNAVHASSAEFLVFRRGHVPTSFLEATKRRNTGGDVEDADTNEKSLANEIADASDEVHLEPQTDIFTWRNITLDIEIKGEQRRLLDNISGWVKPGTLTALMGVSGAGKTTLLDALAQRTTIGVITGDMLVNGKPLDASFKRKTGYVQQQDLHLQTSTVREALRFSAMLRQPKSVSKEEKYAFVEDVIKMLSMEEFAEAIIGIPGEGLNVEQRKLLTIGVELAAKPALLLFLDEPTSGLDSQSSWSIVTFLRKLAANGQAVLSTIHQPSAILFQEFDRLLFLAKGGKTVYFGDIGEQSCILLDYFERNGAPKCDPSANPAEYILNAVGAGHGETAIDWPEVWKNSPEFAAMQAEIDRIATDTSRNETTVDPSALSEFAMPFADQVYYVTERVFQQYWRTPSYLWGKFVLSVLSALFIGFSFYKQNSSIAGMQNVLFAVFMLTTTIISLIQQLFPHFVTQRDLFEVRERPCRAYSWKVFLFANIIAEVPWQTLVGIVTYASVYYPVFGTSLASERQGLFLLYCIQFFIFSSSFAQLIIAGLPDAETASHVATSTFALTLTFTGILQPPDDLPGFWKFMWRVSPQTYTVGGLAAVGLAERHVRCASNELARFTPPKGLNCALYLSKYFELGAPGQLLNPNSTTVCEYCPLQVADQFLHGSRVSYGDRWRNWGIGWAYIIFNVFGTVALYYILRIYPLQKRSGRKA